MLKCQVDGCNEPATFHITEADDPNEQHYCEEHAREHLASGDDQRPPPRGPRWGSCSFCLGPGPRELEGDGKIVTCPKCGISVPDFSNILRRLTVSRELVESFPEVAITEHLCLPIACDDVRNRVTLAIDFSDPEAADFFRFVTNRDVDTVYADGTTIREAIARAFGER